MSQSYKELNDEEKLELCRDFVARGATLPDNLRLFLVKHNLYQQFTNPR